MKTIKMARKNETGEHFFECPADLWDAAFEAHKTDKTLASPMPVGHQMFKNPAQYNCKVFEVEALKIKNALAMRATWKGFLRGGGE